MESQTITVEEAARICNVSRATGYRAARSGQLPAIRPGRRLVISKPALEKMLQGCKPKEVGKE